MFADGKQYIKNCHFKILVSLIFNAVFSPKKKYEVKIRKCAGCTHVESRIIDSMIIMKIQNLTSAFVS